MDFVAKQSRLSTSKEKPILSIKFDFYNETKVTQRSAGISILAVNFTLQHEDHYKGAFYLIMNTMYTWWQSFFFFYCVLQSVIAALFRKVNAIFFLIWTRNIIIYCLILSEYWDKINVSLTFPGVSVGIKFKISLFSRSYVLFGCCTTGNAVF